MKRQKEEVRMFKLVCRTRVGTFRFGGFSLAFGHYCPNLVKSLRQANLDLRNSIFRFVSYVLNLKMVCWKNVLCRWICKLRIFLNQDITVFRKNLMVTEKLCLTNQFVDLWHREFKKASHFEKNLNFLIIYLFIFQ